jgi:glycosyltransferase involved in cell wall biosynthesis
MISIIVAIYNGERFLRECLESLRNQTLNELRFILVDDGSTDSSGRICEEYAGFDPRFSVVHTENRGLCKARETGIGIAAEQGARYIGFADCDDWLEPDMYRELLLSAEETGADVTECGFYREYSGERETWIPALSCADKGKALSDLLGAAPHDFVWNKLWKAELLNGFVTPIDGAYADDMSLTWRVYTRVQSVAGIAKPLYHYRQVETSIAHVHNMNLVNKWKVVLDRYLCLDNDVKPFLTADQWKQVRETQLKYCVFTAGKNWLYWLEYPKDQQEKYHGDLLEMSRFVREKVPPFGKKEWELPLRLCTFLIRYPGRLSLLLARWLNVLTAGRQKAMY